MTGFSRVTQEGSPHLDRSMRGRPGAMIHNQVEAERPISPRRESTEIRLQGNKKGAWTKRPDHCGGYKSENARQNATGENVPQRAQL